MADTANIQGMGSTIRPSARCRRGSAQRVTKRAPRTRGDGFLNYQFKPVWCFDGNRARAEKDFFRSLSRLQDYYQFLNLNTWLADFPQNIYVAWQTVRQELMEVDKNIECYIIKDEQREAVLATAVTLPFNGLHCIPVRAFWALSQRAEKQAEAETLLYLFAYLNQQAGVPFYQEPDSFMDYQYENVENWLNDSEDETEDDEEREHRDAQLADLYQLRQAGGHIMPLLHNPRLLANFHEVVSRNLSAVTPELAEIARQFAALYNQYPDRNAYQNINAELQNPFGEDTLRPDQYLAFYWSGYDELCDMLDEHINCSLENLSIIEEPVALTVFDKKPVAHEVPPLDYERRLFKLMDELRDYLEDCEHGKYHGTL